MKLRTRFSLSIIALLTLAVTAVSSITLLSERRLLRSEIEQHNRRLAGQLVKVCEEALYGNNLGFVNYVRELRKERGFRQAFFADAQGIVRMHSNPDQIDVPASSPRETEARTSTGLFSQHYRTSDGEPVVDLAAPAFFQGRRIGTVRLLISERAINDFLKESTRENLKRIGAIAAVVLAVSLLAALALAWAMVNPIQQIVRGMNVIAGGQLGPIYFPARHDELGWMAHELNLMAKKLRELDEMKRDFVSGVTHDFKSPLGAIQSAVEILETALPEPGQRSETVADCLLSLQNNSDRLQYFVRQLLEAAAIEKGVVPLLREKTGVAKILEKVRSMFQPLATRKGLALTVQAPSDLMAHCDPDKIEQVIANLVSNSLKFTSRGSVRVSALPSSVAREGKIQPEILFAVRDTGPGIPLEAQAHVFEKFYTTPVSRSAPGEPALFPKGSGLGLAIAKGWVEAHGGRIWVESKGLGSGTAFFFALPVSLGPKGAGLP